MDDLDVISRAQLVNRNSLEKKVAEEASRLGLLYFDLRGYKLSGDLLEKFESSDFFEYSVIPLDVDGTTLTIGTPNPQSDKINEFQSKYLKEFPKITLGMISNESFRDHEEELKAVVKEAPPEVSGEVDISGSIAQDNSFEKFNENLGSVEIQNILKVLIAEGHTLGVSDIHVEPAEHDVKIRVRIDGVLHEASTITKERYRYLRSQIELKSDLKLNVNYPQNGRFKVKIGDIELSVRVEVMPALFGDDIVMRMFNVQTSLLDIPSLGIRDVQLHILESALARPHGMILVVGPTGSGKTTTIYSILNRLNRPETKLITLEDPVEYTLSGATQSQINEGESFDDRLKAVLREDPDIIMVGEIRDAKTAKTALQAAITGHLLISTLHANDSVTAVPRIIGLVEDVASFLDSVNVIIAQRLVRTICPYCIQEYTPEKNEAEEIEKILKTIPKSHKPSKKPKFFTGKGCKECNNIGFKGRVGIFEFLKITPAFQVAVKENATLHDLKVLIQKEDMLSMEQDGFLKSVEGKVSISEVLRVIKE